MKNCFKRFLSLTGCVSILIFSFVVTSCENFALPKKISVKTESNLQVPLGRIDLLSMVGKTTGQEVSNLNEFFKNQIKELFINMANPPSEGGASPSVDPGSGMGLDFSKATVYEFDTGNNDDPLSYVLHLPLMDFNQDLGGIAGGLNPDSLFGEIDLSGLTVDFALPSVDPSLFADNDIEIEGLEEALDEIKDKVKLPTGALIDETKTIPEGIPAEGIPESEALPSVSLGLGTYAEAVEFKSGSKLVLTVSVDDVTSVTEDFEFNLTAAITSTDPLFSTIENTQNVAKGGTIELDMGSKIPGDAKFTLTPELSGGTLGTQHEYTFNVSFDSGSEIVKLYSLQNVTPIEIDVAPSEVSLGDGLGGITFTGTTSDDAELDISITRPSQWETNGPELTMEEFTVTGFGADLHKGDFDFVEDTSHFLNAKLDLGGRTVTNEATISAGGKFKIDFSGADIDLTNLPSSSDIKIKSSMSAGNFSVLTVNLGEALPSFTESISIPKEITLMVSEISFGSGGKKHKSGDTFGTPSVAADGLGISCKITSNLPCEIPVSLECGDLLSINTNIPKSATDEPTKWTECKTLSFTEAEKTSGKNLDFNFAIGDGSGSITLTDYDITKGYSIKIEDIQLVADLDYIKVNADGLDGGFEGDIDLSMLNLKALAEGMGESPVAGMLGSVEIPNLPLFIYANLDTHGSSFLSRLGNFDGKIDIVNSETDVIYETPLDGALTTIDRFEWPSNSVIKTTDEAAEHLDIRDSSKYSVGINLGEILDKDNPALKYNIGLGSGPLVIYSYDLDSMDEAKLDVSLDMAVVIPLKVSFADFNMDLTELIPSDDSNEDVFQRKGASDFEEFVTYADSIESVYLNYKFINNAVEGLNVTIDVKFDLPDGIDDISKQLVLESGSHELNLTKDEIKTIMTNYPVKVTATLDMPAGDIILTRAGAASPQPFILQLIAGVQMDGNTPITVWQSQGGN